MSVKQIRLYTGNRKIHDYHSHKEHSTHFPHPHSLFVNLPQTLTHPSSNHRTSTSSHTLTDACENKRNNLYCKSYICSTTVGFDSLTSTVNNYHGIDRLLYVQPAIFFSFIFVAVRSVFRSCLLLPLSFEITLRHSTLGKILRTRDQTMRPPLSTHNRHTSMPLVGLEHQSQQANGRRHTPSTARPQGSTSQLFTHSIWHFAPQIIYWSNIIKHKTTEKN